MYYVMTSLAANLDLKKKKNHGKAHYELVTKNSKDLVQIQSQRSNF